MSPRQIGPGLLLCLVAGCASQQPATGAAPLPRGPNALIRAQYYGGMLNRQAEAIFKVEENAYVMVGHLGGDGRIDILYPEDGRESGFVRRGKWFRTQQVAAYYDAFPQFYSFSTVRYRSAGAQLDSYDGRGYGFIFLIASKRPLRFDRISEFGLWNDLVADSYDRELDPRIFIKAFADSIAGPWSYTLKFARSMGTVANLSYADYRFDCALLQEYSYLGLVAPYGYYMSLFRPYAYAGYGSGCGSSRSFALASFGPTVTFTPTTTSPPPMTPTNTLRRPPHRPLGDPTSAFSSFGNRTSRRNSPDNPAAAPRDWAGITFRSPTGFSPGGYSHSSPRSPATSGRASSPSANPSTTNISTVTQPRIIERTESRPMETTNAKPIVDREKP